MVLSGVYPDQAVDDAASTLGSCANARIVRLLFRRSVYVPLAVTRPCSNRWMTSQDSMVAKRCAIITSVLRPARCAIASNTDRSVLPSRALVASSKTSTAGS